MIVLTWMGLSAWLFPADDALAADAAGSHGRLAMPVAAGRQISLIIIGMQIFWDLPMTLTKTFYDPGEKRRKSNLRVYIYHVSFGGAS